MILDVKTIKKDFPVFSAHPDLVYLDSSATSLKPRSVIDSLLDYYRRYSANIYRGIYRLSEQATQAYEDARASIAAFIHGHQDEVVFTRNTTESLNLVAYSLGRQIIRSGDEIVTSVMEHHSNFVPWQQLAVENDAVFKIIDINNEGNLLPVSSAITRKTKLLVLTLVSNVLGTINPIKEIIRSARHINPHLIVVVDGAQAVSHMTVDVSDLGCDFFAFSSHKMLGPTGVGILWGRYKLLETMFPFNLGGEMISEVLLDKTTFKNPPHKFEAGTPAIGEVIALKEAVKYLHSVGMDRIKRHEANLTDYLINQMRTTFGQKIGIVGPRTRGARAGIVAFTFKDYHPHDIAQILDESWVCIRAGHHCAMPLHMRLELDATARVSLSLYNDESDVDRLIEGLKKTEELLE